jgi:hypothetical protein
MAASKNRSGVLVTVLSIVMLGCGLVRIGPTGRWRWAGFTMIAGCSATWTLNAHLHPLDVCAMNCRHSEAGGGRPRWPTLPEMTSISMLLTKSKS